MLNQDKCGDAIRSLQESKKSEYDILLVHLAFLADIALFCQMTFFVPYTKKYSLKWIVVDFCEFCLLLHCNFKRHYCELCNATSSHHWVFGVRIFDVRNIVFLHMLGWSALAVYILITFGYNNKNERKANKNTNDGKDKKGIILSLSQKEGSLLGDKEKPKPTHASVWQFLNSENSLPLSLNRAVRKYHLWDAYYAS